MTKHEQFQQCWEKARAIVAGYRSEAPEGCDPQNTWVAIAVGVGGAAISAGTQMYSANQKKKEQEKQAAAVSGTNFGKTPEAAMYEPVDFNQSQLDAILANRGSLDSVKQLVSGENRIITEDALQRAKKLIPGYSDSMRQLGVNANNLINARLPADLVEKVVSDRSAVNNGVNIPGLAGGATLKDLGLTSLDAINQGTGLLGKMVSMAEAVSPRASYANPRDSMVSPSDRIRLDMEQSALRQQSEQSRNNLAAGAPPGALAGLGLQLGQGGTPGVDWGQVGGSVAQGLLAGYAKSQAGKGDGGYDSSTGYYTNPGALTNAYATPGYTPIYGQNKNGYYFQSYQ